MLGLYKHTIKIQSSQCKTSNTGGYNKQMWGAKGNNETVMNSMISTGHSTAAALLLSV